MVDYACIRKKLILFLDNRIMLHGVRICCVHVRLTCFNVVSEGGRRKCYSNVCLR